MNLVINSSEKEDFILRKMFKLKWLISLIRSPKRHLKK